MNNPPTETQVVEAVATIQRYLVRYDNYKTGDGPYIQVGVDYLMLVDCNGGVMGQGQAIEEVLSSIDAL